MLACIYTKVLVILTEILLTRLVTISQRIRNFRLAQEHLAVLLHGLLELFLHLRQLLCVHLFLRNEVT